jgi:subtilisin family serine protease
MSRPDRSSAGSLIVDRLIAAWTSVRGTSPRRRRGAGWLLGSELLEARTLLSVSAIIGPTASGSGTTNSDQSTFNLQLRSGTAQALSQVMPVITAEGATVTPTTVSGLYVVQAPAGITGQLAAEFSSSPAVEYAQPVQMFQIQTAPNDADYVNGDQWQLNGTWGVNPLPAWNVTTGSDQVIVADVDSGLNYNNLDIYDNVWLNQPEIPSNVIGNLTDVNNDGAITFSDLNNPVNQGVGKIEDTNKDGIISGADVLASTSIGGWVNSGSPDTQDGDTAAPDDFIGWNFVTQTNNPADAEGHGSFTAGEIGEMTNNMIGGAGLVWNTQIMPVVFLDSSGSGTDTAAAEAIEYAVNHGASVINASWGGTGTDSTIASAIAYADAHNVIIVAAAGNNSSDDDTTFFAPASYSAQYPNLISVAAIGSNGALAGFSNFGVGTVALAAPGVNVFSMESNGTYGTDSGTSMAAPLVTGAIALVEAAHPSWTMSQVIDAVLDTVTPDPQITGKVTTGGVLNVGAAVANTDGPYVVSAAPDGSINGSGGFSSVQLTFNEEINPATITASQVTLTGPGGVIPAGLVTVTAVSGSSDHEFDVSFPAQSSAGTYTLSAGPDIQDWYGNEMNQNRNGVNGEAADAFTETIRLTAPGSTDLLSITGIPTVTPAGTSETFTVTALDPNGGTDTGYRGTVHFTSTDSQAKLPANYSFTAADAGTEMFAVTFKTAGSQAITATDTVNQAIAGTEENFIVSPGAAESLKVSGFPTTDTAGTAQTFTVTAADAYGNVATGYVGTLVFSSTDSAAVLPTYTTITPEDQGTLSFTATLNTAGIQSITASDSATSSITGTESNINVLSTGPKTLVVAGFPTTATAGVAGNVTVTAYNADGSVATDYTGTVVFSSSDGHAVLPASYTFTSADAGTFTFPVTLETAGTQSISVTDSSTSTLTGSETGITVEPAALAKLVVSGFPTSSTAGMAHNFAVTATDLYGNVITGYLGTVDLSSTDPNALLSPTSYIFNSADAGTHSFSATLKTAGLQSITATDTTNNVSGTEASITVQPATLAKLVVSGFPTSTTAGTAQTFTVTATDPYGNAITGYLGTVDLSSTDPNALVSPTSYTFNSADAGTHSFSATLETAGLQSIKAIDTTNNLSGSETGITVQPAPARSFTVTGFPANPVAGTAYNVTVTALDAYNNVASGYMGTVALTSSDGHAILPADYTFNAADAGTHTFSVTLETAGTQSITATDTQAPTLTAGESAINVQAATAKTVTVTGFPATDTAGVAALVTVTAHDAYGNVANGYLGTVDFSSSDGHAGLPADYTFTAADAGTHTFSLTLVTAGAQSITATGSATATINGSESNITVKAAAAKTLVVAGFPTTDTAGVVQNVVVTALDAFGNVASGYTGNVAFSSSDGHAVMPANYTFNGADAGTRTFSVTLETAGAQSITVTDTTTSTIAGSESNIVVGAATAKTLTVTGFPATDTAGVVQSVVVIALDAFGNVATGYVGTVVVSSTDGHAVLPADFTFTALDAGSHSFPVTLETAGAESISAQDVVSTSVAGTESGITVEAAAARSLAVTGFPAADTAGESVIVTVTAYDAYSNVASGYAGTVALTSSDHHADLPANYTFTSGDRGIHTFPVTFDTAGTQSITAEDVLNSTLTGVQSGIVVSPAPAGGFTLSGFPSTTAGAIQEFTVTAVDPYGNTATSYTGTIDFESSDHQVSAGAGLPSNYTFTTGAGLDNGVHVFSAVLKTAGVQSITAQDTANGTTAGAETGIIVSPAAATRLVFGEQPTDTTAGVAMTPAPTLLIEDVYGNVVTGNGSMVTLTLSEGTFAGGSNAMTANAVSGVATFSGLKIDVAGANSVSAADGSLAPEGASAGFTIRPAAAARLVIATQPSSTAIAGQRFATGPQVYEEDEFGNLETGDSSTVVSASVSVGKGPLQGTTAVTVSGGVATFTNLSEDTAETITLSLQSGTLGPAFSNAIEVSPAAATQLVVTTPPPAALLAGQTFTLVAAAEDPYGNVEPGFSGNVTVSVPNDPSFTTTVAATNGAASFVGLTLDQAADGEAIRVVAAGLSSAVTNPVSMPSAPTIIGENVVTLQKKNKKGKAIGKPAFVGFALVYSEPMNSATAGLAANYQLDTTIKKRVKKKTETVIKPVSFVSVYDSSTDTVTLTVKGKPNFAKGGQISVMATAPGGVASAEGELLSASDTDFTMSPKAKSIEGPL